MLKKGDRVEFQIKGEIKYGVVSRGGRNMVHVLHIENGEKYEVKGHFLCFKLSNHTILKDEPSDMDRYSIKNYKEIRGHGDSRTFSAVIVEDGNPIMHVNNDGWGGSNQYEPYDYKRVDGEDEKRFFSTVKAWVAKFGYADMLEPEDSWIEWWQHERPLGVTAKSMIDEFKRIS